MAELIWAGKYDAKGRKIAPVRYNLEFQTVETVNESVADRLRTLNFLTERREPEWRNRLIWGDKKYVLPSLLKEFAGKVNLIYIDPPFATGANFSYRARIPDNPETEENDSAEFVKQPSMIEEKAYRDTWGRGIDSYLQWFYETAIYLRELLADNGSIYVHLDWHVGHYAKVIMDDVFGAQLFRNEIARKSVFSHSDAKQFGRIHDTLLFYTKSDNYLWNTQYQKYDDDYVEKAFKVEVKTNRRFQSVSLNAPGSGPAKLIMGEMRKPPPGRHWSGAMGKSIEQLEEEGRIVMSSTGVPRVIYYLDESPGKVCQSIWTDVYDPQSQSSEKMNYDTQKSESLLDRILSASSNPSDIVLDCFVGSGTTAVVAEKLGRRWIACDLSRFAIHTTRKRLLGIKDVKPFIVQNLGKYERQAWQAGTFRGKEAPQLEYEYRQFILGLYHAEPVTGFAHLHGVKAGRMVHVGTVDAPVTLPDVKSIALELRKAVGSGGARRAEADILYWDLAFDMNETAKNIAGEAGVQIRFFKIPREVMDQKAVDQGDVKFFELAALSVKIVVNKLQTAVKLTDFAMPTEDVPEDVKKAITHFSQWIDYWAVDWDYKDDTFHNEWQSYRTKKEPKLLLETNYIYEKAGSYKLMIKVIDIFGNDTTKLMQVEVR